MRCFFVSAQKRKKAAFVFGDENTDAASRGSKLFKFGGFGLTFGFPKKTSASPPLAQENPKFYFWE
jgi:hypothetical protein